MKKVIAGMSVSAVVIVCTLMFNVASPSEVSATDAVIAQADEGEANEETSVETEEYTYIAQPGDSYIQMARKAVQTYGINTDTQIGAAGVLFAETNLTNLAGWPALNEGQTVTISKASVEEWVNKAADLTAEEKANWDYYVPFVDFHTNHVGEAPKN